MTVTAPYTRATQKTPVGELLWLAVTAVAFAVIMGIVSWPLSAELTPRLAASLAPAPGAASTTPSAPAYSINRLPLPEAPPLNADQGAEGSSGGAPTLALAAPAESSVMQPTRDTGGPAATGRRSQQARSDAATRKKAASPSRPASTLTPPTARDARW